ncbi:putative Flagellar basal-body rod protein FlgF [uncultured Desulfatiglans sp.]|nr:putative Flagellar basal-body rod protein FlgF [uncultured Desulfatiglans sp.]
MTDALCRLGTKALLQEMRMDVLANNLANINTAGFKGDKFGLALPPSEDSGYGADRPMGGRLPFEISTVVDFSPGTLKATENPLDVALSGEGLFCVENPLGETLYTRKGRFALNGEGEIVTQDGWPVMGQGGRMRVEGTEIMIEEDGSLFVDGARVDRFRIVRFESPELLEKAGDTVFRASEGMDPKVEADEADIRQGFIELSNVDAIRMMTEMIETVRGYESYQKMMQVLDQITTRSTEEVGRIS